jgi:glycosyltransferase involved in cell wall biosynthesis
MLEFSVTSSPNGKRRRNSGRRTFVYVVCGDRHVERLNVSLRFLKKFSRSEIVIVASRTSLRLEHDQVVHAADNDRLNDHQMGLLLKTNVHRLAGDHKVLGCYLDTDVIATHHEVNSIFDAARGPFAFAPDHVDLSTFSSWAVACGCRSLRCDHLSEAIRETFSVDVDSSWQHWNAGVFVFSEDAAPLLDCWHEFTQRVIADASWQTRDQGTLIAAAWKMGLQHAPTLPRKFNFIVDCFHEMPLQERSVARACDLPGNDSYSLRKDKTKQRPAFLHFINGGVLRRGWREWDEVERLLEEGPRRSSLRKDIPKHRPITDDNRIVHGLWIGQRLSKLELLTIHSFLRHGHEFHLWLYDDLETLLPDNVILENAEEILPHSRIFRRRDTDPETGVGRCSLGSFADLFRYKLLFERGGWWADMDVTCLRPFDFQTDYVFRSHRVGVVNNIIKCPPRSMLMKMTYEQAEHEVNENSPWLLANRTLFENIVRLKLDRFLRADICNKEDWLHAIKPLIEEDRQIPEEWYAVHWINEMWRTLQVDGGRYKGRRYVESVPSKEEVPERGTLGRLYREHGLLNDTMRAKPATSDAVGPWTGVAPVLKPTAHQPVCLEPSDELHINVLLPNLALGGAERSVVETLQGLANGSPTAKLFLMGEAEPNYSLKNIGRAKVFRLQHLDHNAKLRKVSLEVFASPNPVLFTHLIKTRQLRALWNWGVTTIPVVQNSRPSWQDEPSAFDHPRVPFIVAVSENVAGQIRAAGCPKPIVTVRHEIQRWFSLEELRVYRQEVRERHSIPKDTLLIGMVGEFKSQKAYTRAVRVLAEVRHYHPAKLMILGGWDHDWGHGRAAYVASCRQALDLGVMSDFLTPGPVQDIDKYYAAFDVFLNTSVYEGLSVAMLEAAQAGCPIVSADAGGNRECLSAEAVVVEDSSDIRAYVSGIEKVLKRRRRPIPVRAADADLVPRLWCLLGQYGRQEMPTDDKSYGGSLFLTDNLNLGGAARSLVNLLCRLPSSHRAWLGILNDVNHQAFLDELERTNIPVFSLRSTESYLDRVERILAMRRHLGAHTLVFWNVDARVKLLLAKILAPGGVRLIDVSPGPWLFEDLNNHAALQRRIALDNVSYFNRLDHFVAKYAAGAPPGLTLGPGKLAVIPNGVQDLTSAPSQLSTFNLAPKVAGHLVIGTCCRILPSKRFDFLVDMMSEVNRRLQGVTMVVVGAANRRYERYWRSIIKRAQSVGVSNIDFVGQQADVVPYLRLFRVFVMLGTDHGCPNASLEAMSLGLPIVTARNGGTSEQVENGVNGFLVSEDDPAEMAHRVRTLLTNPEMRRRFGEASRKLATEKFSIALMVERYVALLNAAPNGKPSSVRNSYSSNDPVITNASIEGRQTCTN